MEDVAKELQITIDIEFTVDFGHALPLCIMSTRKIFKSWLYDNYMKPLICYAGLERFDCLIIDSMQYGYLSKIPASMMRYSFVGDDILMHVDDIVKLVKQRIGKGWYCVLFLDFYYIRGMYSYQTSHFAHEVLIYGYDDTKQMISAIVFYNT